MTEQNNTVTSQLAKLKAEKQENGQFDPSELKVSAATLYQHYKSPKVAMRAVTTTGVLIKFVNFELLTLDPEVIEYLDDQIKRNGLPGVTKGEPLTLEDRNPEKAMERRLREEIEARVAAEVKDGTFGKPRQLGNTENAGNTGAVTSGQTAS